MQTQRLWTAFVHTIDGSNTYLMYRPGTPEYECNNDRMIYGTRYINGIVIGQVNRIGDDIYASLSPGRFNPRKASDMQTARDMLIDASLVLLAPHIRGRLWVEQWSILTLSQHRIEPYVLPGAEY